MTLTEQPRLKLPIGFGAAGGWIASAAIGMLLSALTGCVIVPYRPKAEIKHDTSAAEDPGRARLSIRPPKLIEKMARATLKQDKRLQRVDGKAFVAAIGPGPEISLAQLLDPSTQALIGPLHVDYLVVFSEPISATLSSSGGGGMPLGYAGAVVSTESTSYQAAVIDLQKLQLIDRLSSRAVGTDTAIGLFFAVGVISDTEGSARKGIALHVVQTLSEARPAGPIRVVFLAGEGIQ